VKFELDYRRFFGKNTTIKPANLMGYRYLGNELSKIMTGGGWLPEAVLLNH